MTRQQISDDFDYLFSKINWGASHLDARAIRIMNNLPSACVDLAPAEADGYVHDEVYYQPSWTEDEIEKGEIIDRNGDSWTDTEVFRNKQDAEYYFPDHNICEYRSGDIGGRTYPHLIA